MLKRALNFAVIIIISFSFFHFMQLYIFYLINALVYMLT